MAAMNRKKKKRAEAEKERRKRDNTQPPSCTCTPGYWAAFAEHLPTETWLACMRADCHCGVWTKPSE